MDGAKTVKGSRWMYFGNLVEVVDTNGVMVRVKLVEQLKPMEGSRLPWLVSPDALVALPGEVEEMELEEEPEMADLWA